MGEKKVKKKKLRFKGVLVIILFIYLMGSIIYYLWQMPLKNIEITGNNYLKDNYLIDYLNLDNTNVFKVSTYKLKKKLLDLELIKDVKIKKNYFGKIKISITENDVLFYNLNNKKVILTNGKEIDYNENYLGIPVLINYVPEDIYQEFIAKLDVVDKEVLRMVSEIEYSRLMVNDKVIDDKRFLFRMNDGNQVYINTINIEKFNDYLEIYAAIVDKNGDVKGCLYLDSNSENNHFNNCESNPIIPEGENKEE